MLTFVRVKPFLVALLASLALVSFGLYEIWREQDLALQSTMADTHNMAHLLEQQTRQTLGRVDNVLSVAQFIIERHGLQAAPDGGDAALQQQLRALLPSDGLVTELSWLAADGSRRLSTRAGAAGPDADARLQEWWARLKQAPAGGPVLGRVVAEQGHWLLPMGRALDPPAPRAEGAAPASVVALFKLDDNQIVLDGIKTGTNGFVTLFLRDGWMLQTAPRKDALLGKNWLQTPMFTEHLPTAPGKTVRQVVVRDNTERVYSYRALKDYPVVVSAGISLTDALGGWRAHVRNTAVLLAAATAGLLLGAWWVARSQGRELAAERSAAAAAQQAQQAVVQARDNAVSSERFLRTITDSVPLRIAYADPQRRYRFANQAYCERYGLPREQIIGRTHFEVTGQEMPADEALRTERVLRGEQQTFENAHATASGVQHVQSFLVPDVAPGGQVMGYFMASADVTLLHQQQDRIERSLQERETLLREVYHRVKNNLQVVQSLLSLQRRSVSDGAARAALDDSARRVQAMALVHEKLYQTDHLESIELPGYVNELLHHLADTLGAAAQRIELVCDIAPRQASLETAVPLGLLINELVSNAIKHAFPAGRGGRIRVQLSGGPGVPRLSVQDDGVGVPAGLDPHAAKSMGLQLAVSLAGQLGGRLELESTAAGAVFAADLPRLV